MLVPMCAPGPLGSSRDLPDLLLKRLRAEKRTAQHFHTYFKSYLIDVLSPTRSGHGSEHADTVTA